ncbi:hypothetical protein, partial [Pseudomonas syringae group genomosp. 7]|uniref:hypothetical protein n=1 Tax=Pseudomonas syringae group genomosp. 7 TaxID=251699 RepID=UPI00376F5574
REGKLDLLLHSEEDRIGRLNMCFDYADELFDRDTIVAMARHYVCLLTQVSQHALVALGEVQLLGVDELDEQAQWSAAPCT